MKKILLFLMMLVPLLSGPKSTINFEKNSTNIQYSLKNQDDIEEFLSYWTNDFRKTATCDVKYADFKIMYDKYMALSVSDREIINTTNDPIENDYTIKQVIDTLIAKFYNINPKGTDNKETLEQSTTIIVVVVVAVFGMSTILIFFILKNNKVIE